MSTPRTKKSPAPSTAKKTGAEPRAALPEGRPSRVYPPRATSKAAKTAKTAGKSALGKLAAFGGEARLEERVAALEKVVTRLSLGLGDALGDVAEALRRRWEEEEFYRLTEPLHKRTRRQAFMTWQAGNFAAADERAAARRAAEVRP